MLTYDDFRDKKHIIMDKPQFTVVMNKNDDGLWDVISLPKIHMLTNMNYSNLCENDAYEYYRCRMQSFGFRPFQIIAE